VAVWIVRAGSDGEQVPMCLEKGLSVIGWSILGQDMTGMSKADIRAQLDVVLADKSPDTRGNWAGQLDRFVSVMKPGDFIVMPYKHEPLVAIGRVEGPYAYRPELGGDDVHVRPVSWREPAFPREQLPTDLLAALSGAVPTVQSVLSPTADGEVREILGLESVVEPVHIVLRWATKGQSEPARHAALAEEKGSVWWGKVGNPGGPRPIGDRQYERLTTQLAQGVPTHVYLYRLGEAWRTTLLELARDESGIDSDLVPGGEGEGAHHLWLRLTEFERLEPDWPLDHLVLDSAPARSLRSAVGGQSTLFFVREVADVQPEPERYFILLQRGTEGEYSDVEGQRYRFDDSVAGRKALLQAQRARFVYYRPRRGADDETSQTFFGHGRVGNIDEQTDDDGDAVYVAELEDYEPFVRPVPLDEYRPPSWNGQHSIGQVTLDVYEELLRRGGSEVVRGDFDARSVRAVAETEYGLMLPDDVYEGTVAALTSGKHIILTGPPGTAKTTLAQALGHAARLAGLCSDYVLTTATADWTTFETIGGLRPRGYGTLAFHDGHFLAAIRQGHWLLVDELNRSNFDKAFGQLFTVLSGQPVTLPYEDPGTGMPVSIVRDGDHVPAGTSPAMVRRDWRLIATMNVFDKFLLFEMSYALMRRFAFIEVPAPPTSVYETLIAREAGGSAEAAAVATGLLGLRKVKELGPALFMDIARYARRRFEGAEPGQGTVTFEAFYSFLLPQFEGIDDAAGKKLYDALAPSVPSRERLLDALVSVLGLERGRLAPSMASFGDGGSSSGEPDEGADEAVGE
jgi:MoxR-like ATPase